MLEGSIHGPLLKKGRHRYRRYVSQILSQKTKPHLPPLCVCINTFMCTFTHTNTCIYLFTHARMCMRVHTHTHKFMYLYTYIPRQVSELKKNEPMKTFQVLILSLMNFLYKSIACPDSQIPQTKKTLLIRATINQLS